MTWQLLKDGIVLKEHPTKLACQIEAIERHLAVSWGVDFPDDRPGVALTDGVQIVEAPYLAEDVRRRLNGGDGA